MKNPNALHHATIARQAYNATLKAVDTLRPLWVEAFGTNRQPAMDEAYELVKEGNLAALRSLLTWMDSQNGLPFDHPLFDLDREPESAPVLAESA